MTVILPYTLTAGAVENVNHVQANDEALRDAINAHEALGGAAHRVTAVTALPASPTTGDQCVFQTAAMAALAVPVAWRCWYDGTKWVPSGPSLFAEVTTQEDTTSSTYVDLATVGPSIALPVAGDYDVEIGAEAYNSGSTDPCNMSYAIGATAASNADEIRQGQSVTNLGIQTGIRPRRKTGLGAVTLTAKYRRESAGTARFKNRWMRVTPVRLG